MSFKHKLSKRLAILWALMLACGPDDRTLAPSEASFSSTIISQPGTVSDLSITATSDTSVSLAFTAVDDGAGLPASYDVRLAVAPLSWGAAASTSRGTCSTPVTGAATGSTMACTVLGLASAT